MAVTSQYAHCCIAGITVAVPMWAVLSTPKRILLIKNDAFLAEKSSDALCGRPECISCQVCTDGIGRDAHKWRRYWTVVSRWAKRRTVVSCQAQPVGEA